MSSQNNYYTHSDALPAMQTRGASSIMQAEFDLIAQGFTLVQANMALKVGDTMSNLTVTGFLIIPTMATSDNSQNAASTAFVAAAIAAAGQSAGLSSITAAPNKIPIAGSSGLIDNSWLGQTAQLAQQSFYNS